MLLTIPVEAFVRDPWADRHPGFIAKFKPGLFYAGLRTNPSALQSGFWEYMYGRLQDPRHYQPWPNIGRTSSLHMAKNLLTLALELEGYRVFR